MTPQPLKSLSDYQRLPRPSTDTQYYKQYLETVCNNATLALFVMDEYQQCVYMNPAAEQLTGYTLAELEGRALHDAIHHTRPDGTPYPLCECPIDQVFPQNNQEQGEEVFVHRDGHFYSVAYTASPIREGERTIGTVIEVRDITQEKLAQQAQREASERERILRQEAETAKERAETVLQSITDAFAVLDRDWRYVYVNQAATELLNRTETELIGNRVWDVFPDIVGSTIDLEYRRAVEEKRTIGFEFFYPRWNRWYLNRIYPSDSGASIFITDITDRKQTEQALQESEVRFRSMFECNMIPIGIWKVNGELGDANDALLDLIGYTRSELESEQISWKDLTPIEWAERDTKAIEETIAQGYCAPYEKEFFHKDGRRVPILISGVKVREDAWGGFFFAIDLTHLKQTEAELREADSMLASALAAGSIYTWRWRIQDNLVSTDAAFANLFGVDPAAAAKGLPIEFFLDGMHPDDREAVAAAIQKAIATGEDYLAEYRVRSADGKLRWVAARGRVEYDTDGTPISFPGAISDITERKQIEAELEETEERLRLAIGAAKLGTWDFNLITGQIIWNDACRAMFGVANDAEITYQSVDERMHPDDRERVNQQVQSVFDCQSDGDEAIEYRIRQVNGSDRWVSSRGKLFCAPDGTPLRWIGTLLDITEVKQREAERQLLLDREKRLREQAEQANRIKDEFLAVLSHELRTPLNPILGWVRMLKAGKCPPAKVPQALDTIERNAQLQTQLIEDLLDVSRILQGKLTLNSGSVNLAETIRAALETVQLAAESKAIDIDLHLDSEVEPVRGDANRLQQVIWNLLSNAVKFTPHAGRVKVTLSQVGTEAQIQIRDTGKGIRSDVLPYIFDRFRQADSSTTRQFGGLGLGLAIARHLVELHGGTISAESAGENQGATFTVRLPIALSQMQSDVLDLPKSSRDLAGIKILAVDDEPDNLDFLVFLLEAMGAIVESAQSAKSAFEKLAKFQPDLLISDIAMPDLDGYQLIQQIREQTNVPAIALTAYAGETNQRQILAAGFQQHLAKPVDPDELVNTIVSLLN